MQLLKEHSVSKSEVRYIGAKEARERLHVPAQSLADAADKGLVPYRRTIGGTSRRGHRRYPEVVIEHLAQLLESGADWPREKEWWVGLFPQLSKGRK